LLSRLVTFQAEAGPVGLDELTTLPLSSTATHMLVVGQDTLDKKQFAPVSDTTQLVPSTCTTFQAAAPPEGLVEVTTLPTMSTATHRPVLGQDKPDR
jgi:hypothetical protein